jgi:hypothetical protein
VNFSVDQKSISKFLFLFIFINILRATFAPIFAPERKYLKLSAQIDAHMTLALKSCFSNVGEIYEQLFCTPVIHAAFLYLKFGLIVFWHKKIGGIATRKMLVKLTLT